MSWKKTHKLCIEAFKGGFVNDGYMIDICFGLIQFYLALVSVVLFKTAFNLLYMQGVPAAQLSITGIIALD